MAIIKKINDTQDIPNSRMDRYWTIKGFEEIYPKFRKGLMIPKEYRQIDNAEAVVKKFNIAGIQFGNWCTNEDRYNYVCSLYICLYDLHKILKLKNNNIGLKILSVSFGARGVGTAIAHYESNLQVINITRYKRESESKTRDFVTSGGIGAFAHEYGHFLDYYIGQYFEPHKECLALTNGRSCNRKRVVYDPKFVIRNLVEDILEIAYWDAKIKFPSDFYNRIRAFNTKDYYVQRNEIFARLFEQYIQYKLKKMKVYNHFLSEKKYYDSIYMNNKELSKVIPLFDKIIAIIQQINF